MVFHLNYIVQSNRLNWACHVERMEPELIPTQLMEEYDALDARNFVGRRGGTDRKVQTLMLLLLMMHRSPVYVV
jgi:hypothetical protein